MKIKGIQKETITVEIDELEVLSELISVYKASYKPRSDAYLKTDGYWYYDTDMRGRGSDIENQIRKATEEEITREGALDKFFHHIKSRKNK